MLEGRFESLNHESESWADLILSCIIATVLQINTRQADKHADGLQARCPRHLSSGSNMMLTYSDRTQLVTYERSRLKTRAVLIADGI